MDGSPGRARDRIAEEQAALRRVAVLVAGRVPPEAVFATVAQEGGRVLDVDFAILVRYDPQDVLTVAGTWTRSGAPAPTPVGSRLPLGGRNVTTLVYRSGRTERIDYDDEVSGVIGDVAAHDWRLRSSVGVPIRVEGRLWGAMVVAYTGEQLLPADAEARLAGFIEMVAVAVANAQARTELRGFAEEQAALRRVATLVARGASPEEVFGAVAEEVARLLGMVQTNMLRYDADGVATVVGVYGKLGDAAAVSAGDRFQLGGRNATTLVFETGRPARIDSYASSSGALGAVSRAAGYRWSAGVPISVEGRLWGVIGVVSTCEEEPLPADAEARLAGFTELAATAIANAQARTELRVFAEEQAALRRVAMLVARAAPPKEVFTAVAEEAGRLLTVDYTVLSRYDADGLVTVIGGWARTDPGRPLRIGLRLKPEGRNIHALVFQTGQPTRIDDYGAASGAFADVARDWQYRSSAGVPISVEGRLWGVMIVGSRAEPLPVDTEARLAGFTELVGTAIANADAQAALTASRARIVATADATRRRIERDLHDGAQQRLVTLALHLRQTRAMAPRVGQLAGRLDGAVTEVTEVLDELREMASGIHPAILTEGGLRPALRALARRCAMAVSLDIKIAERLPEAVEIAAYYVVSEALTNTVKHADASAVEVKVAVRDASLRIRVRDDGRGGADFARGSGLAGLKDRIEVLGGRISLHSRPGAGTILHIVIPLGGPGQPAGVANSPTQTDGA